MTVNACRSANESFTRFTSNCIGAPYNEPGRYNQSLRSTSPLLLSAATTHSTPFTTSGNKTVRKAEFSYTLTSEKKGSHALRPFVNRPGGFYNRKTAEPFTNMNSIGYTEDPYERKEDISREEYARLNSKILMKN